jgi:1-phosphatidylinositol-4-phosphate 5-kinase
VARDSGHDDGGIPGIHVRGSPLRASVAGDPEVDLLLPGTARYDLNVQHISLFFFT